VRDADVVLRSEGSRDQHQRGVGDATTALMWSARGTKVTATPTAKIATTIGHLRSARRKALPTTVRVGTC
jgi:hypothetical protein